MASGSINIPDTGSPAWKDPVANLAALPATGNSTGDARVAEDTQVIYIWSGSTWNATGGGSGVTALTGDVTGTGPGTTTTTIANSAVTNAKIANATINLTTKVTGVLPVPNGGSSPASKVLYVDGDRTDTYTATGSISLPFKTIMAAVDQIIANGDNSLTVPYVVALNPAVYNETISLNNAALQNIVFEAYGTGETQSTQVTSAGTVIDCTSNNTNLQNLMFFGITFTGDVILTGDINGTNLGAVAVVFNECNIIGGIQATNLNNLYAVLTDLLPVSTQYFLHNVAFGLFEDADMHDTAFTFALTTDNGGNTPSQFGGTFLEVRNCTLLPNISVDAGSAIQFRLGNRIGSAGHTLVSAGDIETYQGTVIRSDLSGTGTLEDYGARWSGTRIASGGITNLGITGYTPGNPAKWNGSPTTIQAAIDRIAAVVGNTIPIP